MTLPDKVALCLGGSFWATKAMPQYGIPALTMCDGPHGLRRQENAADMLGINASLPATCFPTAVSTACSWDEALLADIGQAIAAEALASQVGLVLGPGVNIKRNPLCGRNFEYFSEDPFLAGRLGAAFICAAENAGIGTALKHFACNNQEYKRFASDSVLDERTLREIYLPAFEFAVKAGKPSAVMNAYNRINGAFCSDSKALLTGILREEWGFEGFVVTDWGAMNDRINGMAAGCDLIMPGGSRYMEKDVLAAVESGALSEADVDACAGRILRFVFKSAEKLQGEYCYNVGTHHQLARRAAAESAVLLKNDGILPLAAGERIALIGHMAKSPRYQGAGSSHINPTKLLSLTDVLPDAAYAPGCDENGDTNEQLLAEAVRTAQAAQGVVLVVGLPGQCESEGFDRANLRMTDGHLRLIDAVTAANPDTVVLLFCGGVVETPWAEKARAILYMGLPGQAGAEAAADLLYGRANPCGKLAETWPLRYEDCPSASYYSGSHKDAQYREGLYVGYRYYETANVPVRWCFGHGLSYTQFEYSDLQVDGNTATVTITNTGTVAGSEIVQLYVSPPAGGLHRPDKELKGFAKIALQPGESGTVRFALDDRSFAVWDNGWRVPGGAYTLLVGSSIRDIRLQCTLPIEGECLPAPPWQKGSWYEHPQGAPTQSQWEAMLGRTHVPQKPQKGSFTMANSINEMKAHSLPMRLMHWGVERTIAKGFGGKPDYSNPEFRLMMASSVDGSLSCMEISGGLPQGLLEGLLEMANGHFVRGIGRMMRGR
jgi:beta-glucosidase